MGDAEKLNSIIAKIDSSMETLESIEITGSVASGGPLVRLYQIYQDMINLKNDIEILQQELV